MNHYQYDNLRTYAMEPLSSYFGTPLAYAVAELGEKLSSGTARLKHEGNLAKEFWACRDLTPQEKAAAHLLAVISNHRAISWWREPDTPNGTAPLSALEPWQDERLRKGTTDAARAYAAFLPERQAAALMALVPSPQADTPSPAPDSASNAPVATPPPVATGDVAYAFDGLRGWNEKAWKDTLGSPPMWLDACIAIRGQRGVREHHWNPVLIGAVLVHNGHAKSNSVRARFQTKPQLKCWLEAWKNYEADNFETQ